MLFHRRSIEGFEVGEQVGRREDKPPRPAPAGSTVDRCDGPAVPAPGNPGIGTGARRPAPVSRIGEISRERGLGIPAEDGSATWCCRP